WWQQVWQRPWALPWRWWSWPLRAWRAVSRLPLPPTLPEASQPPIWTWVIWLSCSPSFLPVPSLSQVKRPKEGCKTILVDIILCACPIFSVRPPPQASTQISYSAAPAHPSEHLSSKTKSELGCRQPVRARVQERLRPTVNNLQHLLHGRTRNTSFGQGPSKYLRKLISATYIAQKPRLWKAGFKKTVNTGR